MLYWNAKLLVYMVEGKLPKSWIWLELSGDDSFFKEEWAPDCITKFGWDVKVKSIQEN